MNAKIVYKDYTQNESLLFPPTLGELVPENHPVRIVNAVIDRLDIMYIPGAGWRGCCRRT